MLLLMCVHKSNGDLRSTPTVSSLGDICKDGEFLYPLLRSGVGICVDKCPNDWVDGEDYVTNNDPDDKVSNRSCVRLCTPGSAVDYPHINSNIQQACYSDLTDP